MKAKYLALGFLACVGMASCSDSDNLVEGGGQGGAGGINAAYLAVNINNVGTPGSRADGDFEDGDDNESKVSKIRFYFFESDGSICRVDGNNNYKDFTPNMQSNDPENDNIVQISETILVLPNVKDQVPATMVTIVNPPSTLTGNLSLSDLKGKIEDYATGLQSEGTFVMSNSVYADGANTVCETEVGPYLKNSEDAARATPVDVYVERVLAKVNVTFSGAEQPGYLVSGTDGASDAIYAKVIGWGLVGTTNQSYLLKSINPTNWTSTLGSFSWNDVLNHRSYWANTTGTIDNSFKYSELTNAAGTSVYTQESTPTTAITDVVKNNAVKIVVAAQLVDKDGIVKPRYEYLGGNYGSADDILTIVAQNFGQYYVNTGGTNYSQLRPEDLELKSGASMGTGYETYNVYPQLKSGVELYTQNALGGYDPFTDLTSVNNSLKAYHARIWTDGKCYYTTTIQHLGTSGIPMYGVVRNHVYKVTISDIQGLGTPVYNPDTDELTPTIPSDEESYLAAKINVLAWKVVSSDVTFGD